MFLGAGEIVVVLAVALMVLGPKKMPEVARNLARFVAQLRRMADDVRSQVDDALQEPQPKLPAASPTEAVPPYGAAPASEAPDKASGETPGTPEHEGPAPDGPTPSPHSGAAGAPHTHAPARPVEGS